MKLIYNFILLIHTVYSAKILGFFYVPAISHQNVFRPIWKELSLRGHEVTVITPNPIGDQKLSNLTEIDVSIAYNTFKSNDVSNLRTDLMSIFQVYRKLSETAMQAVQLEIETDEVQRILQLPEDYFDLILIEAQFPLMFGIQHKFKAPLIAISSLEVSSTIHHAMGNPIHPYLYHEWTSEYIYDDMSLMEKLDRIWNIVGYWFLNEFFYLKEVDAIARKYFGQDMPFIGDLVKNTSLLFLNVNPIFSDRRPYAPNVKHFIISPTARNDSLPEDLKKILDDAKNGAVYFSLGTNVRFSHVQDNFKEKILKALGELPYTVLCKWDGEDFPGKPKNVILRKWYPQNLILAHPNIKVFVFQGGLQSSEEAISNGVPLVVIPFLADQPMNAKILTKHGIAETIYPGTLTDENLKNTILKVANDKRYRTKAKELKGILLDQPQNGLDKIIWWCEYVIRHKGAKHLRSPGGDISLYQYFMLDIFILIVTILFVAYKVLNFILRTVFELLSHSQPEAVSKKKKL